MYAGILIIQQAGGYICDFDSQDNFIETGSLIVYNNFIFNDLTSVIKALCNGFYFTCKFQSLICYYLFV